MSSLSAAYVLIGGRSTRMRTDKAVLPWPDPDSPPLVERVASIAFQAAGSVTLVGDPERYRHLGFPVIPDLHPGLGPLSGVEAALAHTKAHRNLILACDLPELELPFLQELLRLQRDSVATADGRPALCAVLSPACLPAVRRAMAAGELAWHRFVRSIDAENVAADPRMLFNMNSPKDLAAHE